jgi:hypothetical protein
MRLERRLPALLSLLEQNPTQDIWMTHIDADFSPRSLAERLLMPGIMFRPRMRGRERSPS